MSGNKIKVSIAYSMLAVDLVIVAICFQLSLYFRFRTFRLSFYWSVPCIPLSLNPIGTF